MFKSLNYYSGLNMRSYSLVVFPMFKEFILLINFIFDVYLLDQGGKGRGPRESETIVPEFLFLLVSGGKEGEWGKLHPSLPASSLPGYRDWPPV